MPFFDVNYMIINELGRSDPEVKIPTIQEGLDFIKESGGVLARENIVDPAHAVGGISTHLWDHIHYYTSQGIKGTIEVSNYVK